MLEQQIEQDLKTALLGGDRLKADTLRSIKSALLYAKVEKGKRESGLGKEEEMAVLSKESKKRQESADLYQKGNNEDRAQAELAEKAVIDHYLPEQMSEDEIKKLVNETIAEQGATEMSAMGRVIAAVKEKSSGAADGATVAKIVKESLSQ